MTKTNPFAENAVQAESLEDFYTRYYQHDRYAGRGQEYVEACLKSGREELEKYGYTIITHQSSVTGQTVAYFADSKKDGDKQ